MPHRSATSRFREIDAVDTADVQTFSAAASVPSARGRAASKSWSSIARLLKENSPIRREIEIAALNDAGLQADLAADGDLARGPSCVLQAVPQKSLQPVRATAGRTGTARHAMCPDIVVWLFGAGLFAGASVIR